MNRDSAPLVIYIVSHTHWDREWYHPAARFRQRLIPLVDELLDASPDDPPFLLDGQAIILEDYLTIRPTARDRLASALRAGRLDAGPWYVLADELIPGGEALVRNLLTGRRILGELGGTPPPVLYSPDAFGHPAALPLLAHEFGLAVAVLWRGLGGAHWPPGDTFRWVAPDDSLVVVHHLPPDGYEFGAALPVEPQAAQRRWDRLRAVLIPRARLSALLVLNGADHHAPQSNLGDAVSALAAVAAPNEVRRVGMREAALALLDRANAVDLPEIRGELRTSSGYTWSLQGTFAVRAPLKRQAIRLERTLVRDVEPWLAFARRLPGVPAAALEQAAWKTLLACHPHDTLCGCAIDAVARDMGARLESGFAQAAGLRTDALDALIGHDPDEAAELRSGWQPAVVVRNRVPRARSGVAEVELLTFVRDVPVGPGSAFTSVPEAPDEPVAIDGGRVPFQLLEHVLRHDRLEPRRRYPDDDLVRARRGVAWVENVPGYGVTALPLTTHEAPTPEGTVRVGQGPDSLWMENEWLRLTREGDGSFSLVERHGMRRVDRLVMFEDIGDVGDTYTPSLIGSAVLARVPEAVQVVHAGPLRGEIEAQYVLPVPESSVRSGRAERTTPLSVSIQFTLDAGAPFLRANVCGVNAARDHRLRVIVATGVRDGEIWADAAFGPVRRAIGEATPDDSGRERTLPTAPMHRYVTAVNDTLGTTVFSDGFTEYEALSDGRIAVTLFRGVGELSRADLPERPGHAGWPASTPEAQCLGPFEAGFAILLHGPRTPEEVDRIERSADDVLDPLAGETIRALLTIPEPRMGVELDGMGLGFGAVKRSEDGEWLVLRCVNLLERAVPGAWRLHEPISDVRRSRLDETPGDAVPYEAGRIPFVASPRATVTLLVR